MKVGAVYVSMKKTIIGSGNYNLDTIVVRDYPEWPRLRPFTDRVVREEVGGTCGNVMSILAWLGWDARPLVCLDDSPEGLKVAADLKRFGCDCRHVTNLPGGGTTLLRCTHKKDAEGRHVMSVRAGSPGGSRFPRRRYLRARDEAPAFLEALEEAPAVFFFDDPTAGNRLIAKGLRERGSLVYFEPSKMETNADLEAIHISNIIKFSDENVPVVAFADAFDDKLFIQTMGANGVRFKLAGHDWVRLPAVPSGNVVDTEGAGDWTTAIFLDQFLSESQNGLEGVSEEEIERALTVAQTVAAQSVSFISSLGMIHEAEAEMVPDALELIGRKEVRSIFSGTLVRFVHELPEGDAQLSGAYSDGLNLVDFDEHCEDDIQQMFCRLRSGGRYNLEDFYAYFGAYEKDSAFPKMIAALMRDRAK